MSTAHLLINVLGHVLLVDALLLDLQELCDWFERDSLNIGMLVCTSIALFILFSFILFI